MSGVPAAYPYARVATPRGTVTIRLLRVGPAFITGELAAGIQLRAPRPSVTLIAIAELTSEERAQFGLPEAVAA